MCVAGFCCEKHHDTMSAESLNIINSALTSTGHTQITSLTDGSTEAEVSSANYEYIVRAELTKYPWSHSKKYKRLNRLNQTPNNGWAYVYQLDSDLLKLVVVEVGGQPIEYERHGSELYCDAAEDVYAEYIFRSSEDNWPYDFRAALGKRLQALFLRSLAEKIKEAEAIDQSADILFLRAKTEDAKNQTPKDRRLTSRLVGVRGGH